ncbi:hypothetical protein F7725_003932 [Dissostichus mawsoni]|uniref:Uncharacterized protein n=1 Tax=Dissostichus mawsoni TaxID=36200 RepID=A0A7J5YBN4_DISMA|nr:hypothetical protein F7725_003932 [Dissostichus mawsoni]
MHVVRVCGNAPGCVFAIISVFNLKLQAGSRYIPPCRPSLSGGREGSDHFLVSVSLDSKKYNKGIS